MLVFGSIVSFVLGASIGSFIHASVGRLHEERPIGRARSACQACRRQLTWFELIPVLSFLALRGRCRTCRQSIGLGTLSAELVVGALYAIAFALRIGAAETPQALPLLTLVRDWFALAALAFLFLYDFRYQELPDAVTIPSAVILAIFSLLLGQSLASLALGIAIGGGFFLAQYVVSRGRWIGGGDIRFGALMGALLGWPQILVGLFLSYIIGAAVAIPLLLTGKKAMGETLPLGTFLAIGTIVTLWFGPGLLAWYLTLV